jgi:dihydroxyacetone kinase-like protein
VQAMLQAAAEGIMARGQSSPGDKTLLDVLVPVTNALGERPEETSLQTLERISDVADACAERTKAMIAKRGRASYAGERSIGSVDAGAAALALIIANLRDAYRAREESNV